MGLLKPATNEQAYGKVGILGFAGSGKSFTAALIAIGICEMEKSDRIAFFDTETGSDFLVKKLKNEAGIKLLNTKSRSFTDLLTVITECEIEKNPVLIIDSITHVWRDLCESYDKKLKRNGRLQFQDWAVIKKEWHIYTDLFINSRIHIIVCGRAGFEYDYSFDERGNKDLIKTGIKMKVENEFGFEPSLVLDMERVSSNAEEVAKLKSKVARQTFKPKEGSQWTHRCHVMKDRFDLVNGESFDYPNLKSHTMTEKSKIVFGSLMPHFLALNIGGAHKGIDTTRTSEGRFDFQGKPDWQREQMEKKIVLEEIQALLVEKYPSHSGSDKTEKAGIIKTVFETGSWTAVENKPLHMLQTGLERIKIILNPKISADQITAIHALFKTKKNITDHDIVRDSSGDIAGIDNLESMKDITKQQASTIIAQLKEETDYQEEGEGQTSAQPIPPEELPAGGNDNSNKASPSEIINRACEAHGEEDCEVCGEVKTGPGPLGEDKETIILREKLSSAYDKLPKINRSGLATMFTGVSNQESIRIGRLSVPKLVALDKLFEEQGVYSVEI